MLDDLCVRVVCLRTDSLYLRVIVCVRERSLEVCVWMWAVCMVCMCVGCAVYVCVLVRVWLHCVVGVHVCAGV